MKILTHTKPLITSSDNIFDMQNIVRHAAWARLICIVVPYIGALLLQLLHGDFLCPEIWQSLNVLVAAALLLHIVFIEIDERYNVGDRFFVLLIGFDIFVVIFFLTKVGLFHSGFLMLLLSMIMIASLTSGGVSSGFKYALYAAGALNMVLSLNHYFDLSSILPMAVLSNISIFAVAGLGGYVGQQLYSVSENLATQREEIEALTNINEVIVENIPSGLIVVDKNYRVTYANRGAAKIFSDLGLEGKFLKDFFIDLEKVISEWPTIFANSKTKTVARSELNYYNYKKEKLTLEIILSKIFNEKEKLNYLCLIQNVTEIKNLEFSMRQKEKLAAVGQLAAGIAHEIRNPLASISGSVQLLQGQLQTQSIEDKKLLSIMVKEIDRLNRLVTEFLDYVRPDVRSEDPVRINNLIKDVIEVAKLNHALAKNVQHRSDLRARGIIVGHYDKLKQALMNIVINSYQAMADTLRPELFIQSYDSEGKVVLLIQDNGMGMSTETQRRIFEPFHTTKPKGTGLGLAITHKILESHEAEILIESEIGKGTKLTIIFPGELAPQDNEQTLKRLA